MSGATTLLLSRSAIPHVLFESARTHLPECRGLGVESAKRQEPQFSAASALRIKHLQTGIVRTHERNGNVDHLFAGILISDS